MAEMQHITLNEFMPLVIGKEQTWRYKLFTEPKGYSGRYELITLMETRL